MKWTLNIFLMSFETDMLCRNSDVQEVVQYGVISMFNTHGVLNRYTNSDLFDRIGLEVVDQP